MLVSWDTVRHNALFSPVLDL